MLDLRLPIGLMFSVVGAMLLGYGIYTGSDAALYARSLGININLWWGIVLLVFGLSMLGLARWAAVAEKNKDKGCGCGCSHDDPK